MSFLVILACLAIQWFFGFNAVPYRWHWADRYIQWTQKKFSNLVRGHGLFDVAILVLPIIIAVSLIFTLIYHLFGHLGYLLTSLALLWYCIDSSTLKIATASPADTAWQAYQNMFALLFWYFIFGPVGLSFYVVIHTLHHYFSEKSDAQSLDPKKYFALTQDVLDWVPVRLLGLSFALVSNFGAVFKEWIGVLFQGIIDTKQCVTAWCDAALGTDKNGDVVGLLRRAVIVWLIVMLLVTIGILIG